MEALLSENVVINNMYIVSILLCLIMIKSYNIIIVGWIKYKTVDAVSTLSVYGQVKGR